jgi:hypothetical protein
VDSRSHPAGPLEVRLARRFGVADHTRRLARCRLGLQEGNDREDAAVGIGGHRKMQLLQDACHVFLDATVGQEHGVTSWRLASTPPR